MSNPNIPNLKNTLENPKWKKLAIACALFCLSGTNYQAIPEVVVDAKAISQNLIPKGPSNKLLPETLWENNKNIPITIENTNLEPNQKPKINLPPELLKIVVDNNYDQELTITISPFGGLVFADVYHNEVFQDGFSLISEYLRQSQNLQVLQRFPPGKYPTNDSKVNIVVSEEKTKLEQTGIDLNQINQLSEAFQKSDFKVVNLSRKAENGQREIFCTATFYNGIVITATHCLKQFQAGTLKIDESLGSVSDIFVAQSLPITPQDYTEISIRDIAFLVPNNPEAILEARKLIAEMAQTKSRTPTGQAIVVATTKTKDITGGRGPFQLISGKYGPEVNRRSLKNAEPEDRKSIEQNIFSSGGFLAENVVNIPVDKDFTMGASGSLAGTFENDKFVPLGVASSVLTEKLVKTSVISTIQEAEKDDLTGQLSVQVKNLETTFKKVPHLENPKSNLDKVRLLREKNYSQKELKENRKNYLDSKISSTTAGINDFRLLTGRNYLVRKIDYDIITTLKKIMVREVTTPEITAHLEKWTMSQYQYSYEELLKNEIDSFSRINLDKNEPMTPKRALEIMRSSPLIVLKIEPFYSQFLEFENKIIKQENLRHVTK